MFQLLFKYPLPVFTKGRFVLLSAWPGGCCPCLLLLAAGGPVAAHSSGGSDRRRPTLRSWRAMGDLGNAGRNPCACSLTAVAARDGHQRTEFAAKHHRCCRRRLAQHGDHRQRWQNARGCRPRGACRTEFSPDCRSVSRLASTGSIRNLEQVDKHARNHSSRNSHPHRRRSETACGGNVRPSCRRNCPAH